MNDAEPKLAIELVPKALWGESLAGRYRKQWDKLRVIAYAAADHRCEICGGTGSRFSKANPGGLEAHEVWEYVIEGQAGTQKLIRLIALCPRCHACKHMGRAGAVLPPDELAKLKEHFLVVNNMTLAEFQDYQAREMEIWRHRNTLTWSQDLTRIRE